MLDELQSNWLEVCKIPTDDGRYKRVVMRRNADWYREFCGDFISYRHGRARRPRTLIKRYLTEAALRGLIEGRCDTVYQQRLLPYAARLANERAQRRSGAAAQHGMECLTF